MVRIKSNAKTETYWQMFYKVFLEKLKCTCIYWGFTDALNYAGTLKSKGIAFTLHLAYFKKKLSRNNCKFNWRLLR
jgi:hypothetical protein